MTSILNVLVGVWLAKMAIRIGVAMRLNVTHSYATLEISKLAYDEIAEKLRAAGYNAFDDGVIDMHGLALECSASNSEAVETTTIESWLGEQFQAAEQARRDSMLAPNSFGAGYDQGRYDVLREALAVSARKT